MVCTGAMELNPAQLWGNIQDVERKISCVEYLYVRVRCQRCCYLGFIVAGLLCHLQARRYRPQLVQEIVAEAKRA